MEAKVEVNTAPTLLAHRQQHLDHTDSCNLFLLGLALSFHMYSLDVEIIEYILRVEANHLLFNPFSSHVRYLPPSHPTL